MAFGSPCNCRGSDDVVLLYEDGSAPPRAGNIVTLPVPNDETEWRGVAGPGIAIDNPVGSGHRPTISIRPSRTSPVPILFSASGELLVGPVPETPVSINDGVAVRGGVRVATSAAGRVFQITVEAAPNSPVPLRVDDQGRLYAGPIDVGASQSPLLVNSGQAVYRGIQHTAGGPSGHSPILEIATSPDSSSRIGFDASQRLRVDPPYPWVWDTIASAGNTFTLRLKNTLTDGLLSLGTI